MSRRSVVTQKAAVARARTYPDANAAMLAERCGCTSVRPPSQETLDRIAEREMTGGWDGERQGYCPDCNVVLTVLGDCPLCYERFERNTP